VRIPVLGAVRSLNLSTSAGILLYEALRQTGGLDSLP
jgi:tRNA (cytidine/uridine-2'-O-)-methyltransferase